VIILKTWYVIVLHDPVEVGVSVPSQCGGSKGDVTAFAFCYVASNLLPPSPAIDNI